MDESVFSINPSVWNAFLDSAEQTGNVNTVKLTFKKLIQFCP